MIEERLGLCVDRCTREETCTTEAECCDSSDDDESSSSNGKGSSKGSKSCRSSKGGYSRGLSSYTPSAGSQKTPWRTPDIEGANLIAADPGIWTIPDFLSKEEADELVALADKYGDDMNLFGSCAYSLSHPQEGKDCGKYFAGKIDDPKDRDILQAVHDKVKNMWHETEPREYFGIQRTQGGTGPMQVHVDNYGGDFMSITVVLYLTEASRAGTVFPATNITVTPEKGMALTFLDVDEDGSPNPKAFHGVQAMPRDSPDRVVLNFHFTSTPKEILACDVMKF